MSAWGAFARYRKFWTGAGQIHRPDWKYWEWQKKEKRRANKFSVFGFQLVEKIPVVVA
jgi:hypothetical protein